MRRAGGAQRSCSLKAVFCLPDTSFMSKRSMLWIFAGVVAGIAYLIAAGADVDIGSASKCVGLGSFPNWFDSTCEAAIVPRAIILGLAAIPVVSLIYFAERDVVRAPANTRTHFGHDIRYDPTKSHYWCATADCVFQSTSRDAVRRHRNSTAIAQGPHRLAIDPRDSMYWCHDCAFWSFDLSSANRHRGLAGARGSYLVEEPLHRPKGNRAEALGFTEPSTSSKEEPTPNSGAHAASSRPTDAHSVMLRGDGWWACTEPDCDFTSEIRYYARLHHREMTEATLEEETAIPGDVVVGDQEGVAHPAASASGVGPGALPAETNIPDHKTCPDCAEEIRFAARKCRFCGYKYEDDASSVGA